MSAQSEPSQLQLLMPANAAVIFMPSLILYLESKIQLQGMMLHLNKSIEC